MGLIKSKLDEIEIDGSIWALWSIGLLSAGLALVAINFDPIRVFIQSIIASLIGVFIAVYFINYKGSKKRRKLKSKYLIKFSPILKRLFKYIYVDTIFHQYQ